MTGFHKDIAYKQNVVLLKNDPSGRLNNLGTSIINVAFIINSHNNMKGVPKTARSSTPNIDFNEKTLDYDLSP